MAEEKRSLRGAVADGLFSLGELVTPFDEGTGEIGTGYWGGVGYSSFANLFDGEWGASSDKIRSNYDAYRKIALVRNCIKLLAHFSTRNGFETEVEGPNKRVRDKIKKTVDDVNRKVNMDGILYQSIMNREIWGRSPYMIVPGKKTKLPVNLYPLPPLRVKPIIDQNTTLLDHYAFLKKGQPEKLKTDQVLYFPLDPLDASMIGDSAISTLRSAIRRKCNLSEDMLQAAKRCWAPFGIFRIETQRGKTKEQIENFKKEIKPGMSIVTNLTVDGKVYDMKPDLNGLVKAEEKVDEEIMGNWQMPKALLSREKTMTKSTLEFSLHALYAGPVAGVQRFYKRQLEAQWYPVIVKALGFSPDDYRVKHIWNPMVIADASLIRALTEAVSKGVITKDEMYKILGWKLSKENNIDEPPIQQPNEIEEGGPDE